MKNILIALLLVFVAPVGFTDAGNKGQCAFNGIDYDIAVKFVSDFKVALNKGDAKNLATFMSYPLRINTGPGKFFTIKNQAEFVQKYKTLFSAEQIKSIQDDNNIFCNYQGAMIGSGGVWFNTENKAAKIFAINK